MNHPTCSPNIELQRVGKPEDRMRNESKIWKTIPGYRGVYEVSSYGEVRRIGSVKTLKPRKSRNYLYVSLHEKMKYKGELIHRLVLKAFCGEPSAKEEARHLDGNPENNKLSNLKWGSKRENFEDRLLHGTVDRNGKKPKLTPNKVKLLRSIYLDLNWSIYRIYSFLGQPWGVKENTIRDDILKKTWKTL